ncbi:amino acid ABC transporter permease [Thiomonas sp. FB-6]|uniref:amino acid ABC transporter permease n=1 Tax=Thiomonas sp. FB-6 TaxID=1158291 RepID=UPI000371C12C|nr:amino acid ABC transporter permease [Thiomonas sp. FB-6]
MVHFTLWDMVRDLLLAARWTLVLSLIAFSGGGLAGALLLLARMRGGAAALRLVQGYVQLFQGTPLLMQLFIVYFGLGVLGFEVSQWSAAALALVLYSSAYLTEIWRGCVEGVPRGQWEASASLGLGFAQQLRHVVLPQALRVSIAPTVGFLVQVVKGTALASVIGFVELTRAGSMIANASFRPLQVYALVAALYFCICYPISAASRALERKFHAPR